MVMIAEVQGVGRLEFPDGTDPNVIQATVKRVVSEQGQDFSVTETLKNIPGSALQLGKDIIQPILSPIQTAKSLQSLGQGLVEKALPDVPGFEGTETENEQAVNAVGKFIKDRYGSADAFQNTLQKDPVGVLADLAGVLTGGSTLLPKTGKVSQIVQAAGRAIDPINLTTQGIKNTVKEAGSLIPKALPESLLESALKIRPSVKPKQRAKITRTALDEGILPTVSGLQKITDELVTLDTRLNVIIDTATQQGRTIPASRLLSELGTLRKKLGGAKVNAQADLRMIDRVAKDFALNIRRLKKKRLTPREVQDLKTDAYKRINFDLQQGKASFPKNESTKAIARQAKKSLEEIDPDIQVTNRRIGDLIELNDELERTVSRLDNRNLISLDTAAKVGAGGAIAGVPGGGVGVVAAVLGNPRVKARTALALENLRTGRSTANKIAGFVAEKSIDTTLLRALSLQADRINQGLEDDVEFTDGG